MEPVTIVVSIIGTAVLVKVIADNVDSVSMEDSRAPIMREPNPRPAVPELPPLFGDPTEIGVAFARAPDAARSLIQQYFPANEWENAAKIGECESGWVATAHNSRGEDSRGWFQINIGPGANTDMANLSLFDPEVNVRAAVIIWKRQGWQAWLNCAIRTGVIKS